MFLFNKNNAVPSSKQLSIDSLVTDPSTSTLASTSPSEAGASQGSDASSYVEMPSPDQRERSLTGKRNSVFNLRSRSNTTTSTNSSFVSVSPVMARPDSSRRTSQDLYHLTGSSLSELAGAKRSLFNRGKRPKRLSGNFSPTFDAEEGEEVDVRGKRGSVLRKSKRGGNHSETSQHSLKNRISSPFDFQHLTHTDRHQFTAMDQASENDLVAEFKAVRASQAPRRDLTGIKADDLHFRNFSSENLNAPESRASSALGIRSPPLSPGFSHPESPQREHSHRAIRGSRSAESFSQPGINPRVHRHTQSANLAPPRVSSRLPLAPIDDLPEESEGSVLPPQRSPPNRQSGMWDKFAPFCSPPIGEKLSTISDESGYFGEAVTTPDDSAIHPMTPPFSPGLEDVAEEPERFVSPRPAPTPPMQTPKSPRSPFFESFPLRGAQRTPISRSISRGSSYSSPKSMTQRTPITRPISQMSDTLGSPSVVRRTSVRKSYTARRKSNTWRVMEESWEDDVDYIYDNALEADCDFDWDHDSDGVMEDRDRTPEQHDHERPSTAVSQGTQTPSVVSEEDATLQTRFFPGAFRPSLLVPSPTNVPELESRSAISASTADTGVQTPSDLYIPMDHRDRAYSQSESFNLDPSLLVPGEYKEQVSREEMYDDILADYECSDRHFPLLDAHQSVNSSSRSSHVRSSKRSSYDSSLISSSGQGSGTWSSPIRRSASSSGSLPELVHSRRARRDFNVMVDQLSEQVASFASFCEDDVEEKDDDDTTPPGRPSNDRTFFAADEEDHHDHAQKLHASIEGEVRASLELARRGSARLSRQPPHFHKYASSDGAAKLLASPMPSTAEPQQASKLHNRAASSNHVMRSSGQQYLRLFPSPPKTSPTSPRPRNF